MIGKLRHRVILQAEGETADAGGGFIRTWSNVVTVWARVEPLRGGEQIAAMQLEDTVTHRVTMRHRTGVTSKSRLLHRGRALSVRSVTDPEERNRFLVLLCEEGAAV